MRATVICSDKGVVIDIGGVKFAAQDKAAFETEVSLADLPKLVQLDASALGILKVMSGRESASARPAGRRGPGRPPKANGTARAARRGGKRTGNSIWSGASSFNPRWSNLTPDEVTGLGIDRIGAPLWGKVRDAIKAIDTDAWKELKPKWDSRLKDLAKKGDDKALTADWRSFLEVAQKRAAK
jgi:hypothetical protein